MLESGYLVARLIVSAADRAARRDKKGKSEWIKSKGLAGKLVRAARAGVWQVFNAVVGNAHTGVVNSYVRSIQVNEDIIGVGDLRRKEVIFKGGDYWYKGASLEFMFGWNFYCCTPACERKDIALSGKTNNKGNLCAGGRRRMCEPSSDTAENCSRQRETHFLGSRDHSKILIF